jgi:hypothetical protein
MVVSSRRAPLAGRARVRCSRRGSVRLLDRPAVRGRRGRLGDRRRGRRAHRTGERLHARRRRWVVEQHRQRRRGRVEQRCQRRRAGIEQRRQRWRGRCRRRRVQGRRRLRQRRALLHAHVARRVLPSRLRLVLHVRVVHERRRLQRRSGVLQEQRQLLRPAVSLLLHDRHLHDRSGLQRRIRVLPEQRAVLRPDLHVVLHVTQRSPAGEPRQLRPQSLFTAAALTSVRRSCKRRTSLAGSCTTPSARSA